MKKFFVALFVSCFLLRVCGPAAAAELAIDGRWLDSGSNVVANATVPATVNVYTNETDAASVASGRVSLATDAEGFFRVVASDLDLPADCRIFWLGVQPDGGSEIAPRMKVLPTPFALCAAEAEYLEVDDLAVKGTVTIGTLSNATATAETVSVRDNLAISGSVTGLDNLFLNEIDDAPGNLALFREDSGRGFILENPGLGQKTEADVLRHLKVEDDGMLFLVVHPPLYDHSSWHVHLTIDNGDFRIDSGENFRFWGADANLFFTLPVRKGNKVSVGMSLEQIGSPAATCWEAEWKFYAAGLE